MNASKVQIRVNPAISPDQLFDFYVRNDVCEKGFGKDIAAKVLSHSSLIIGAFEGDKLVGIARALFDGLSTIIMEFCLELALQGPNLRYNNGSLVEQDSCGVGKRMIETLVRESYKMGSTFISTEVLQNCEESIYTGCGFRENAGLLIYYIDKRPYVNQARD